MAELTVPEHIMNYRQKNSHSPDLQWAELQDLMSLYISSAVEAKYWNSELRKIKRELFWSDVIIGLGTASAVAGLPLWAKGVGRNVW